MLLLPFQFRLTTPERVAKSTGPRPFLVILIAISSLIRRITRQAATLRRRVRRGKPAGRRNALIFVHGFNNRFDDAVYRFAQVVHDAKAPGIPVLFTWPSRGELSLPAYTYDRESANSSATRSNN